MSDINQIALVRLFHLRTTAEPIVLSSQHCGMPILAFKEAEPAYLKYGWMCGESQH